MSLSFGGGDKTTDEVKNTKTDPWAPAIPALNDLLGKLQGADTSVSPAMTGAFSQLQANANAGNPYAGRTADLAKQLYSTPSQVGLSNDAYGALKGQLSGVANQNNDPMQTPGMAEMLATLNGDISKQINGQFTAAGRSGSGMNTQALARGLAQGQSSVLLDQYNKNVAAQTGAAKDLQSAGASTAANNANLQAAQAALQSAGVGMGNEALNQRDYTANRTLEIGQQQQALPFQNLGLLASLLYPMAGLGGEGTSTGKSKSEENKWGLQLPLIGK